MYRYKTVLLFLFFFMSCSPEEWKGSSDSDLFNYQWITYYTDSQGRYLRHILKFETWGEGRDMIYNGNDPVFSQFFNWYWMDNQTNMRFEYEDKSVKYFNNVRLIGLTLRGQLDGQDMIFDPS